MAVEANASHFRFGHVTWKRVQGAPNPRTVDITVTEGWRADAVGSLFFNFGDTGSFNTSGGTIIASGADIAGFGYRIKRTTVRHTYAGDGPYTLQSSSCCRIFGLVNANSASWTLRTIVDLRNGNQGSPVSSIPVILQMVQGGLNTIPLAIADPDLGDPISVRMATSGESSIPSVATAGGHTLAVSSAGVLSWNTSGTAVGQRYAAQVVIDDNHPGGTARAPLDFMIEIVGGTLNKPPTCSGGQNQVVAVGTPVSVTITGVDPEGGALTVNHQGLPTGATLTPAAGTTAGSPLAATFSWTPGVSDTGSAHSVTITFADSGGLQTSCSFTITVPANQPPTANAGPDQSVAVGANCNATVQLSGSGSDPENGPLTYSWSGPTGTLSGASQSVTLPPGTHTFTLTVTDNKGASDTDAVAITVADTTAPSLTVPADIVVANDRGRCDAVVNFAPTATDNCAVSSIVSTPASGSTFPTGTTTVTVVATDSSGNTTTKTFKVTVADREAPVILCPPDVLVAASPGRCDAVVNFSASATDNCPGVRVTYSHASGSSFPVGVTTVTAMATDAAGNPASCSFRVVVQDRERPAIVAQAQSKTVECDGAGNGAALTAWLTSHGGASASDNCSSVTWTNDFAGLSDNCGATGSTTVVFTAVDGSGNTSSTTATFAIVDTVAPAIVTPARDQAVECDGAGNVAALNAWLANHGGATATDACGRVTWSNNFTALSDGCGATGSATVTFTATDECGNSSSTTATFTIADTAAPTFTVQSASSVVECDGAGNVAALSAWLAANGGASASDTCGTVAWSHNFTALSDGCGATGTASVTFVATDECGNASSTTASFTIVDTTAPTLASNVRDILPNEVPITFTLTTQDVCGSATVTVTSVTSHAINGSGQVIDKSGSTVVQIAGNQVTIVDSGGVGTIFTIHGTAVDACGNTASAQFVVNVLRPANEGVGNGVDGNTPGHDNNGGNDDPGTSPGNPGAKGKNGG